MAFCEAVGVGNEPITETSVEPAMRFKEIIQGGAEKARFGARETWI